MHFKRVIPCRDVDGGRVVKGVEFLDIRDAGDPVELAAALPGHDVVLSALGPRNLKPTTVWSRCQSEEGTAGPKLVEASPSGICHEQSY